MIRLVHSASFCMQPKTAKTLIWIHPDAVYPLWMLQSGSYSLAEHTNGPSIMSRAIPEAAVPSRILLDDEVRYCPALSTNYTTSTANSQERKVLWWGCGKLRSWWLSKRKRAKGGIWEEMRAESISRTFLRYFSHCIESLDALLPHNADSQCLIWLWEKYSHRGRED